MIAKKIPALENRRGKIKDVAEAYGLTVQQFQEAQLDFLESEGYKPNGDECMSLHDWLIYQPSYWETSETPMDF